MDTRRCASLLSTTRCYTLDHVRCTGRHLRLVLLQLHPSQATTTGSLRRLQEGELALSGTARSTASPTAHHLNHQTNATYKEKTAKGGFLTLIIACIIAVLVWTEAREYLYGEAGYEFSVDRGVARDLQLNFDATVATPCHCASALRSSSTRVWRS